MNAREILSARTIVISTEPHAKATPQQIPSLEASYASRNPATLVLEPQRYDGSSGVTVVPVPLPFTIKSLSLALYFSCVSLQLSIFRRNREYGRLCLRRFDPGPHMLRFIRLIAFLRVCTHRFWFDGTLNISLCKAGSEMLCRLGVHPYSDPRAGFGFYGRSTGGMSEN